jgi:leucyl/phenylalanyl-tRNA--protein transferase
MIPWLEQDTPFPDVGNALKEEDDAPGLLAAGADLSPARLLDAYRHGIFPWYSEGQPILWWSTDPRMVLHTDALHISHTLSKKLRKTERERGRPGAIDIHFDRDFEAVMRACAQPRAGSGGTWISEEIVAGYCGLHAAGYAHSSELWRDGELLAGAYGVSIGRMFYGESMFTRIADGSKIALIYLVNFLRQHGVEMIDCQQETSHLASLGARPIARSAFLHHVRRAIADPPIERWEPLALFGPDQKNFCG